jgi:SH3-like domain-containing protein
VQVVAETSEWRRVCDPDGAGAWVHKRTTDGRRAVMNLSPPAPLLRKPKAGRRRRLSAAPRAGRAGPLRKGWCKVKADGASGWVARGRLWGTAEAPQCR